MAILSAKNSRGRPKLDTEAVNVRMAREMIAELDAWIAAQAEPQPSRPEAIRALVAQALQGTVGADVPKGV